MFLIFNTVTSLVTQTSDTEPTQLEDGFDYVYCSDSNVNLINYVSIKVLSKDNCQLELTPTTEWAAKVYGKQNGPSLTDIKDNQLILMEAIADLYSVLPGGA